MERLTVKIGGDVCGKCGHLKKSCPQDCAIAEEEPCKGLQDIFDRLAAYEDTGLTPAQIKYILPKQSAEEAVERMKTEKQRYVEWFAWKQAEREGRLVVLPCKVGDTVYRVWPYRKPIITEHKMHDLTEIAKYIDAFGITFGKTVFLTREEAEKALKGVTDDA